RHRNAVVDGPLIGTELRSEELDPTAQAWVSVTHCYRDVRPRSWRDPKHLACTVMACDCVGAEGQNRRCDATPRAVQARDTIDASGHVFEPAPPDSHIDEAGGRTGGQELPAAHDAVLAASLGEQDGLEIGGSHVTTVAQAACYGH